MKLNLIFHLLAATCLATALLADSESATFKGLCEYVSGADAAPLRRYDELVAQASGDPARRKTLETDFIRVLTGESTFEAKRFACQRLAIVGSEAAVPALADLLARDETLGIACAALVQIPSPKAGAALRKTLATAQGRSLEQVVFGLGIRGDTKAASQLIALTRSADAGVAGAACVAIGRLGTAAPQKILAALRRESPAALVRPVAEGSFFLAEGLAAKGQRKATTAIYEETLAARWPVDVRRGALAALLRLDVAGAEARILRVLAGSDDALQPVAIAAVPALTNPDASRVLAGELPKLAPFDQVLLIQALALRGDTAALVAIEQQLGATDQEVRLAAIAELGKAGDAATVPVLARTLIGNPSAAELKAVEAAFSGLKGGAATDRALAAQLRNRMAGNKTPILAALVRRGNPASLGVFAAETASADPAMAKLGFQGMSRVAGADDVPALLKALGNLRAVVIREDAVAAVSQALARVGTPARNAAFIRAAMQAVPAPQATPTFLPLLAVCPDAPGLELVVAAAGDADAGTRDLGLRTLADWPDAAVWEPLLQVYSQAPTETERVLALRGLARLLGEQNAKPDAVLIGRYRALLGSAKGEIDRKLILGSLSGCHHPEALLLAVGQLDQVGVRAEAALATRKIAAAIQAEHPQAAAAALKRVQ